MNKRKEDYRTFELCGRLIKIDDFIYRRIFKDPDIKPKRKYRFIKSFYPTNGCPRMVLKAGKNKTITLSRYIMRAGKGEMVDHINRNPLDNRRCNLRIANGRLNALNRKVKNNTGLICVHVTNYNGRSYVETSFRTKDGRRLTFRRKDTPFNRVLTALARDKFVIQSGDDEYAPLNFPILRNEPFRSELLKMYIS